MVRDSNWDSLGLLRSLFRDGVVVGLTDGQLLERSVTRCDETGELAFAELVRRHGPMVLHVCRNVLRDEHDAMDAFQATFLVLVCKGHSLWIRDSLGPWLHQVACRAAKRARSRAIRRQALDQQLAEQAATRSRGSDQRDVAADIHEEIDRLSDSYRMPLVLCGLEGRSYEEAARHLGWSTGKVKSRLAEGRRRLRIRLTRKGLAPALSTIVVGLAGETEAAIEALPPNLSKETSEAAMRFAAGKFAAGSIPTAMAELTEGVLKSMLLTTISRSAVILVLITSLGLGAAGLVHRLQAAEPAKTSVQVKQPGQPQLARPEPATLLRNYETTLDPYAQMKGRWVVRIEEQEPGNAAPRLIKEQEWTVLRDGDRTRLLMTENNENATPAYESIRQGKQWIDVRKGTVSSWVQVPAQKDIELLGMAPTAPSYGIINATSISPFLKSAKVAVRADTLGGSEVYVLRGVTEDVEIDLWLDPKLNYTARRIRFEKRASATDPTVRTEQFDATRFRQEGDRYLVTEAITTFTVGPQPIFFPPVIDEKVADGKRVEMHAPFVNKSGSIMMTPKQRLVRKIDLLEFKFNPNINDRDFKLSQPIAQGTKVLMAGGRRAHYEWRDNKIVLNTAGTDSNGSPSPLITKRDVGAVDAAENLRQAQRQAQIEGKKVFVSISSPSCGYCRALDSFLDANRRLFHDSYVMAKIDTESMNKGSEVAARLRQGRNDGAVPWLAILDADGNTLITSDRPEGNIGCPILPDEIEYFLTMVKRTSTVTETRLGEIRQALENHMEPHYDRLRATFKHP